MKSEFLSELVCKELEEGVWELQEDLFYRSELVGDLLTIPAKFITDFASVPRVPIAYTLFGDRAHRESVLHDWCYYTALFKKSIADKIFLEAMKARGKPVWVRWPMYLGVKFGGKHAWDEHRRKGHPLSP